mmetsp:Transcript_12382/g.26121  ORF Transcript_12382/g.26121 Transcript_12382/m.26121 type:complete len:97 (+) Transcript_12382:252-542(+)
MHPAPKFLQHQAFWLVDKSPITEQLKDSVLVLVLMLVLMLVLVLVGGAVVVAMLAFAPTCACAWCFCMGWVLVLAPTSCVAPPAGRSSWLAMVVKR